MSVEFWDSYRGDALRFREQMEGREFCISQDRQEGQNCVQSFKGSLAIIHYQIFAHAGSAPPISMREYVRNIDRHEAVPFREPFEQIIKLQQGVASDLQVFGYQRGSNDLDGKSEETWCLFRQDLYLGSADDAFLILHWKHMLRAIRILDLIPGAGTRMASR